MIIKTSQFSIPSILLLFALSGCDSVPTESSLNNTPQNNSAYSGPVAGTADTLSFMTTVWTNLQEPCGSCHGTGGQTPTFVQTDDVNLAYIQALTVTDIGSSKDSRLVTKVAAGHNCWESSNSACGAIMTSYIDQWLGASGLGAGKQIALVAPADIDADDSRTFPADSGLFAATVHPLLVANCAGCHVESVALPQAPFFSNSDPDVAYEAVTSSQKVDLNTPANSRLVVRLRNEFHNCWSSDCQDDANDMEAAIVAFASGVLPTEVDPAFVISKALSFADGTIASGGSRYDDDVIAMYEFSTGSGNQIFDVSGITPLLHLTLSGLEGIDFNWVGGWGVDFVSAQAKGLTTDSKKLSDYIKLSGEYSIEAWVIPANVTQEGPAHIISYSAGDTESNFTLGQTLYNYNFLNRSGSSDANGEPALSTADADEDLQATLQHVVVTYNPIDGRRIYINGLFSDDLDGTVPGLLNDWEDNFALVLGDEVGGGRQWQGKLRLVAIHDTALTQEQITRNFDVGVGEKLFLLFNVTDIVNVPQSYILFEVSQFDNYSYLFNAPTFISLDLNATVTSIPVVAMRIGINGKEAAVGQSYRHLNTVITDAQFTASELYNAKAQLLSTLGTTIALENGVAADQFFLTFEQLGSQTNVVVEAMPTSPPAPPDLPVVPDIGLRTFDEINATMAAVTGIDPMLNDIVTTYTTIKQQLPTQVNIAGFLSAHQVAIAQLAFEYCNALVDDVTLRDEFFLTGTLSSIFDFTDAASVAFDSVDKRNQVIDPLLDDFVGVGLATQPDLAVLRTELASMGQAQPSLLDRLTIGCGGECASTGQVVKATCSAVLGSAAMLLQ